MSNSRREAARRRYLREADVLCDACHGTGRVQSTSSTARSKRAGNASYLRSLEKNQLSMTQRGRLGGRPRGITLEEIRIEAAVGPGSGTPVSLLEDGA